MRWKEESFKLLVVHTKALNKCDQRAKSRTNRCDANHPLGICSEPPRETTWKRLGVLRQKDDQQLLVKYHGQKRSHRFPACELFTPHNFATPFQLSRSTFISRLATPSAPPPLPNMALTSPTSNSGFSYAAKCPPSSCTLSKTTGPNVRP